MVTAVTPKLVAQPNSSGGFLKTRPCSLQKFQQPSHQARGAAAALHIDHIRAEPAFGLAQRLECISEEYGLFDRLASAMAKLTCYLTSG